jgi:gamma-glutamylcyclotransferase (GGCT)/AIG2-like uncharacterized protein YtfP
MDRDLLFVYGTLLKRADHPLGALMRARSRLVGEGSIRARLYHICDPDDAANFYPGAVPAGGEHERVHGEVYELDGAAELFQVLDHYEACSPSWPEPHEFLRRRVPVRLARGGGAQACCYLYTWDVTTAAWIASGRYVESEMSARVR